MVVPSMRCTPGFFRVVRNLITVVQKVLVLGLSLGPACKNQQASLQLCQHRSAAYGTPASQKPRVISWQGFWHLVLQNRSKAKMRCNWRNQKVLWCTPYLSDYGSAVFAWFVQLWAACRRGVTTMQLPPDEIPNISSYKVHQQTSIYCRNNATVVTLDHHRSQYRLEFTSGLQGLRILRPIGLHRHHYRQVPGVHKSTQKG